MFALKTVVLSSVASGAFAAMSSGASHQSRELNYAMRQLYAREVYSVPVTVDAPTCASGYDTYDAATGMCECGAGRVQDGDGQCAVANNGGNFAVNQLTEPVALDVGITWSDPFTGPGDVLNAAQCGAICSQDDSCMAFYLTPGATHADTAYCWLIGGAYVYDSPLGTGFPFYPSASSTRARRAVPAQNGSVGANGGQLGVPASTTSPASPNGTVGCETSLGDTPSATLGNCQCGAGRVPTSDGYCTYAPSGAARMARRVARDSYVQW